MALHACTVSTEAAYEGLEAPHVCRAVVGDGMLLQDSGAFSFGHSTIQDDGLPAFQSKLHVLVTAPDTSVGYGPLLRLRMTNAHAW